jgi:hypothetical protein
LDGQLVKESHGVLYSGNVEHAQCDGLGGLLETIQGLKPNQATGLGIPVNSKQGESLQICTKNYPKPNAIPRDKANFTFNDGKSLVLLDYDSRDGEAGLAPRELIDWLLKKFPELQGVGMLALGSASSGVRLEGSDGSAKRGGCHIYLIIEKGADIPAFGKWLDVHGWLRGEGYTQISKSGAALKRNLFDISVFDSCRLIFEAAPVLGQGVTKAEREVVLIEGTTLDFSKLSEVTQSELDRAKDSQEREIQKHKPLVEKKTKTFKRERAEKLQKSGIPKAAARSISQSVKPNAITVGHNLRSNGNDIDVIDVMLNPKKFDGIILDDPFTEKRDKAIFYANSGLIFSFSSGGYSVNLAKAKLNYSASNEIEIMATLDAIIGFGKHPTIFQRANEIVAISDSGEIKPMSTSYLPSYFSQIIEFVKTVKGNEVATCPPDRFWRSYVGRPTSGLPELKNTHPAPIIVSGTLYKERGFIRDCGLFLTQNSKVKAKPIHDKSSALKGLDVLKSAWQGFPFQSEIDEAVCLAALLTLVQRPLLGTSPMFAVSANSPGVGKSQLVEGLSIIASGKSPFLTNYKSDPAEDAKRVLSILRAGFPVVNLDNVALGLTLVSDALCSALTSTTYSDRVLGASVTASIPSDGLTWFATGNNLTIGGDLCRRTLGINLFCEMENPEQRRFDKSFSKICTEQRNELLQACVDILLSFEATSDKPAVTLGSFDAWAEQIGSCVLWLTGLDVTKGQPIAKSEGELEVFAEFLEVWNTLYNIMPQTSSDVLDSLICRDFLTELNRGKEVQKLTVARVLNKFVGKVINGKLLEKFRDRSNTTLFRLKYVKMQEL